MQNFRDLKVWGRAHALVLEIYRQTAGWPADERFGLVAQLRRAAVSVGCNIAEGSKRRRNPDFARFLNMPEGSLAEVEYLLLLSRDLSYISVEAAERLLKEIEEIARMPSGLRKSVEHPS